MSVTFTVICTRCGARAPELGDFGYVGEPSLETARHRREVQTFGFLYAGFASLELRTWDLEAFKAFLERHRGHPVKQLGDGEEIEDEERDEDQERPRSRPHGAARSREPRLSRTGFVNRLYELACKQCDVAFTASESALLLEFEPFVVSDARRQSFGRVVNALESSVERVDGFPFEDVYEIDDFLKAHRSHTVTARLARKARPRPPGRRVTALPVADPAPATGPLDSYGMVRQNACRDMTFANLAFPMKEAWTAKTARQWQRPFQCLPAVMGLGERVFMLDEERHTVARDAATGRVLWKYSAAGRAEMLHEGRLFIRVAEKTLDVVDPTTGKRERALDCPPGTHFVAAGRCLMGHGRAAEDEPLVLWSVDWQAGRLLWSESVPDYVTDGVRSPSLWGPLLAAGGTLFHIHWVREPAPGTHVLRASFGSCMLVARRADTGETRWRVNSPSFDLVGIAFEELLLALEHGYDQEGRDRGHELVAIRIGDGSPAWRTEVPSPGLTLRLLSGGEYHYMRLAEYWTIDARSGERRERGMIHRYPAGINYQPEQALAVSSSHVLLRGDYPADRLFAFTTGRRMECAWRFKTDAPNGINPEATVYFGGRLYYEDERGIRCLAPATR